MLASLQRKNKHLPVVYSNFGPWKSFCVGHTQFEMVKHGGLGLFLHYKPVAYLKM